MITQSALKAVLDYDPETGVFTWRVSRPPRAKAGGVAGCLNGNGYVRLSISGRRYYAHRLAFVWMMGWCPHEIDHANGNRSDNRWENLRAATHAHNMGNVSGRIGYRKRHGRYQARIQFNKKEIALGVFSSEKDAKAAYTAAKLKLLSQFAPEHRGAPLPAPPPKRFSSERWTKDGLNLSQWARLLGIPQPTLHHRLFKQGLPWDVAVLKGRTK